jgi:polygalacturonase
MVRTSIPMPSSKPSPQLPTARSLFQQAIYLSGVTPHFDEGVTVRGSQQRVDYPLMPTRVAGIEMTWAAALINVYEQTGVTIEGKGTIDGDDKIWWDSY